jgi:1,2-diacylglycerol 3-beta-glucosyltransferase
MPPIVDLTAASYATAAIVCYYVALYLVGRPRQTLPAAPERWPTVVFLVPARNEAAVLNETVRTALRCHYKGAMRVLIVDDASSDRTPQVADALATDDQRIRTLRRSAEVGGCGKADVLNHGFGYLGELLSRGDEWLDGADAGTTCICVLDSDGHLSSSAVSAAVQMLWAEGVGSVQIGVRIRNSRDSLLARMQDMEFVGFSFMVQTARDRLRSVGLGGNGQFTRYTALQSLGDRPWRSQALTEDLDLGVRLQLVGWRLRFCSTGYVAQEGLAQLRPLLRQRTRWTQGHYQCWRYVPRVAGAKGLPLSQRLDTLAYLVLILFVVLVTGTALVELASLSGFVQVQDSFLSWMGDGFAYRITELLLAWAPVLLLTATYQRFAEHRLARWEIPAHCVLFACYVYVWAVVTVRAWGRIALRRRGWTKTPRNVGISVAPEAGPA